MPDKSLPGTPVPRWLAPALALWVALAATALANDTAVPVSAVRVVADAGLLALAHGWIHHRWRIAGPAAALAGIFVAADALGLLPEGTDTTYTGPAGTLAPKAVWTAIAVIAGLDLLTALLLHARARRRASGREPHRVAARFAEAQGALHTGLDDLGDRVTAVEQLLARVP